VPTPFAQGVLFVSSYAPLLLIFALLDSWGRGLPSVLAASLALASVAGLMFFMTQSRRLQRTSVEVDRAHHRDGDAIGYVVTYLVPFVGFQNPAPRLRIALVLLVVVIGALYLRSHLFYVNPLLSLAGFRLYEGETATGRTFVLISKRRYIPPRTQLVVSTLSDYVFLDRSRL
jgi:hypothetical protein